MFEFKALEEQLIWLQPYRYLSLVRVSVSHAPEDIYFSEQFFRALFASPAFHNDYLSKDSWRNDAIDSHGPFSINRISTQNFRHVLRDEFLSLFMKNLSDTSYYGGAPPETQFKQAVVLAESFPEDTVLFEFERKHLPGELMQAGRAYQFDLEHSFMVREFVEFMAVEADQDLVSFLVFAQD